VVIEDEIFFQAHTACELEKVSDGSTLNLNQNRMEKIGPLEISLTDARYTL
jgi:hypothetical protein